MKALGKVIVKGLAACRAGECWSSPLCGSQAWNQVSLISFSRLSREHVKDGRQGWEVFQVTLQSPLQHAGSGWIQCPICPYAPAVMLVEFGVRCEPLSSPCFDV